MQRKSRRGVVTSAVGALLAVTIGVCLLGCRWSGPVSDEYAAETARGICASEVERVGGWSATSGSPRSVVSRHRSGYGSKVRLCGAAPCVA